VTRIYELYHMARHAYLCIQPAVKTGQPHIVKELFPKRFAKVRNSGFDFFIL